MIQPLKMRPQDQLVSNAIMIKWENNLIVLPDEQREVVGVNLQVHSPAPSSSLWTQPPLLHPSLVKDPKFWKSGRKCQWIIVGKTFTLDFNGDNYVSWWSSDVTANVDASCGLHSIDVMAFLWYSKCATMVSSLFYMYNREHKWKRFNRIFEVQ